MDRLVFERHGDTFKMFVDNIECCNCDIEMILEALSFNDGYDARKSYTFTVTLKPENGILFKYRRGGVDNGSQLVSKTKCSGSNPDPFASNIKLT